MDKFVNWFYLWYQCIYRSFAPTPLGNFRFPTLPPLFYICITSPVKSSPFFIPSTSFCSLSSWFTSSCTYHLITVTTCALTIYITPLTFQLPSQILTWALASVCFNFSFFIFFADRTNGRAYATMLRLSVVCRPSVTLCIVAKWCVLQQKLLLRAYRNSYMRNRLVPKSMTLTFVQRSYQGHVNHCVTLDVEYLGNR